VTPRQKKFCHEYLLCEDPSEAARRAGYQRPEQAGERLMGEREVQGYLEEIAVADLFEVRAFLTRALRGDGSMAERIKAADMLLKCGISQKTEPVVIFGEGDLQ